MIIEKCLKLFALFFIIVPWTVCLQSNDGGDLWKFVQSTNFSDEYKKKLMNEMEGRPKWIKTVSENPNLEDQLKQCRSQIQSYNDNELRLKQNSEFITIQRDLIADKASLLEIQKNETVKAHQQIDDYKDQLREKELEIKILQETISSYNNTINNNNAQISNLLSIIGSQNNNIVKNSAQILKLESNITNWKETVNKKDAEISRLKTTIKSNNSTINKNNADISKLESTITAFKKIVNKNNETIARLESTINKNNAEISKLKSEKINPRATTPQPRITCPSYNNKSQQEITQLKSEANKQTNEIKELKIKLNKSLSNNKNLANSTDENYKKYQNAQISLESCQGNLESLKNESIKHIMTIQNLILKDGNNQKLLDQCQKNNTDIQKVELERKLIQQQLNICQNDFKIQNADCSNKDSTIKEWRKKAEEERNSLKVELNQCQIKLNSTQDDLDSYRNHYEYERSITLQLEVSKCISLKDTIMKKLKSKDDELNECKSQSTSPLRSLPTSCIGLKAGLQEIQLSNGNPLYVICDNDGWIIIQRRNNGKLDFNRNWAEYVNGFEDPSRQGEFFIGLENLHLITNSRRHEVNISVTVPNGTLRTKYDNFRVGNAESLYELESIGSFDGNYNGLFWNEHQKFSTYDRNNRDNCSANGMGGWWYPENCGYTNLNAPYGYLSWSRNNATTSIIRIRPYE